MNIEFLHKKAPSSGEITYDSGWIKQTTPNPKHMFRGENNH